VIPGEVLRLIQGSPDLERPGIPADNLSCQGAKFHSPRPMILHPFPGADRTTIHLCGTCADNVRLLISLSRVAEVPWTARRCFGNTVRKVAENATEENHA
jgi:hypothetical protein